jgi:hypothetical protein
VLERSNITIIPSTTFDKGDLSDDIFSKIESEV